MTAPGAAGPGDPAPGPDLAVLLGEAAGAPPPPPAAAAVETPTDTGNAARLARLLGDRLRFLPAEDRWLAWDGTRWARDDAGLALHLTAAVCAELRQVAASAPEDRRDEWRAWARASESAGRRRAMLELAGTLPELVVRPAQLDAVPWLLNTPSGVVDLRTLTRRPADPADLLTRRTRHDVDLAAGWTPALREFRDTFQPEPGHWEHLTLVLGSCLRGGNDFRTWLLVHGPTTTGKSMLMEAVAGALGDYAAAVGTSVFRANQDDRPRPDLLRLLGARLVYASEGADAWELHADHVKRLTGGDPLVARGMRSNQMVERVPDFTPVIVCNTVPRVKGADQAVRRRLRALEFTRSVLGAEDPARREAFLADGATGAALLGQLAVGCARAYALGLEAGRPAAWVEATADAFAGLTGVTAFLEDLRDAGGLREHVDVAAYGRAGTASPHQCWAVGELHDAYRAWVERRGDAEDRRTLLSLRAFRQELLALGWEPPQRSSGMRFPGKVRPPGVEPWALWH